MPRERQSAARKPGQLDIFPRDFVREKKLATRRNHSPRNNGRLFSDRQAFALGFFPVLAFEATISSTLDRIPNSLEEFGIVLGPPIVAGVIGVVVNRLFPILPRR